MVDHSASSSTNTNSTSSNNAQESPLLYFLAGALLPTIAYVLLLRQQKARYSSSTQNNNGKKRPSSSETNKQTTDNNSTTNSYEELFDDDSSSFASSTVNEFEPIERTGEDDPKFWDMADAPYKMVLCVNTNLKMGKGKIAAQCCHAAVGCYKNAKKSCPAGLRAWEVSGCAKIAVKCPDMADMEQIMTKAIQKGIPYYFVEDAGRTQIAAGSRTVLGLGPAPVKVFEDVTSHLKLM